MFYELFLFAVALIGSAIGGWIDLKTTEIPDIVPAAMAALGLLAHIINALSGGAWTNVYYSVAVGLGFLVIGYILYYTGQWGEADVLLLAAIGVVLPQPLSFFNNALAGPFPAIFLLNAFIVGGIYSLIYSIIVGARNKAVFPAFVFELKGGAKTFFGIFIAFSLLLTAVFSFIARDLGILISPQLLASNILVFLPGIAFIFIFYKFAHAIDKTAFRKKIRTKDLKEGDVLAEDVAGFKSKLYVGLEREQIKTIQKAKKEVWIKEGVRYGPTFFFAIIATWLWGNLLVWLLKLV